ncbi:MAG: tryptophan synthase subunit alpha [Candidatus Bathyarchaeota archaeon]|nr:tryptophan synthase subunit alpha [Candidatus Bathyarchaeota archaeon]
MRLIERKFESLKRRGEGALIGYITCGDPTSNHTLAIAEALIDGGVDMLELGIPFSDPIADGPVIQRAAVRALRAGIRPAMVLENARRISVAHPDLPIIILTYYNVIFRMGLENFFSFANESNVSGVIVPDMTIEESLDYRAVASKYDIDTIFLAAPSTSDERLKKIVECSSGFLYLVSVFGVTGVRERLREESINFIRRAATISDGRIPVAVGFGVSKPSHIKGIITNGADGAIVGSKIVKIIEENIDDEKRMLLNLKKYVRRLKKATEKI